MTAKDHFGAIADEILDGGNGSADSGIISDVEVFIEGDIKVSTEENLLTVEIGFFEVTNTSFSHEEDSTRGKGGKGGAMDIASNCGEQVEVWRGGKGEF